MQQRKNRFTSGFTFVEIIVVLAVLTIIAAFLLSSLAAYQKRQSFKSVSADVGNNLQTVRQKALTSFGNSAHGVYVGTSTMEFYSGDTATPGDPANTVIAIPTHITATSSFTGGVWAVTFSRLAGKPSATGTITMFDTLSAATTTFTIVDSGIIQ